MSQLRRQKLVWKNGRTTFLWPDHPLVIAGEKPLEFAVEGYESGMSESEIVFQIASLFSADPSEVQPYVKQILCVIDSLQNNAIKNIHSMKKTNYELSMATFNITNRCNLKCKHCYADLSSKNCTSEMNDSDIKSAIEKIATFLTKPPKLLILSGGEPTLEKEKLKIAISTAHHLGLQPRVNTNGILVDMELAQFFSAHNVLVQVSLDGIDAQTHSLLRGENESFEAALRAIRILVECDCRVRISFTVHSKNVHQIPEMIVFAESLCVEQFITSNLVLIGQAACNDLEKVDYVTEFDMLYQSVKNNPQRQFMTKSTLLAETINAIRAGTRFVNCGTGTCTCCIDSEGSLYPCINMTFSDYRLGNILDSELVCKLQESAILHKLQNLHVDSLNNQCSQCAFRYFCGGYCRGETIAQGGDINSPYVYCSSWKQGLLKVLDIISETPNIYHFNQEDVYWGILHRE